ncbi:hypothetical protein ARHIZOSPH14_25190 [Agromyces rhizosphaerae]|uniref:Uncharacterized protein n=1 Tax=Agromyces rhizosphaerae TaxID=88374 RepID=A0A9W6FS22_9MICO|nr:hypothetical protein [Agromyces rhizosphaerae]GLI28277.1 hypothetical protein ARHIZOSPH14_25190 [Agromyces rhizosphaerae]
MTDDPSAALYLRDLGELLKESALSARDDRDETPVGADRAFADGRLMAYHEVVSLMQQQAVAFGIDIGGLSLEDIDPGRDLV